MSPNDYELGYDEGYQDGADMIHLKKQLAEIDKLARYWKDRAEKAEAEVELTIKARDALVDAVELVKARAEKAEADLQEALVRENIISPNEARARLCTKAEWEAKYGDKQ